MDDGPAGQYLHPIAGLEAALWVPPSRGQLFWLRRAPALFAPARGTGRGPEHDVGEPLEPVGVIGEAPAAEQLTVRVRAEHQGPAGAADGGEPVREGICHGA